MESASRSAAVVRFVRRSFRSSFVSFVVRFVRRSFRSSFVSFVVRFVRRSFIVRVRCSTSPLAVGHRTFLFGASLPRFLARSSEYGRPEEDSRNNHTHNAYPRSASSTVEWRDLPGQRAFGGLAEPVVPNLVMFGLLTASWGLAAVEMWRLD
jgi:hypothetical protein